MAMVLFYLHYFYGKAMTTKLYPHMESSLESSRSATTTSVRFRRQERGSPLPLMALELSGGGTAVLGLAL